MRFIVRIVKVILASGIIVSLLGFFGSIVVIQQNVNNAIEKAVEEKADIRPGRKIHKLPESQYLWVDPADKPGSQVRWVNDNPRQEIFQPKDEKGKPIMSNQESDKKLTFHAEESEKEPISNPDPPKPDPEEIIYDAGVRYLSKTDMERIRHRFNKRRDTLIRSCDQQMTLNAVTEYSQIRGPQSFLYNHIFHEPVLELSGCIPPKTGSTSWNHFWWGTSSFDGTGKGKFDSFQTQGNQYRRSWWTILKNKPPKLLFLQTRHPIKRLVSGWNNILCNKNCRDAGRVKYANNALRKVDQILTQKLKKPPIKRSHVEETRLIAFEDWINVLLTNDLDQFPDFDIHFHSYSKACFPCHFPYEYVVRLETFGEDYQYILRKIGLWDGMTDVAKQAGTKKENESVGLDYAEVLSKLTSEDLRKLYEMKKPELDMFGYIFDPETLEMSTVIE